MNYIKALQILGKLVKSGQIKSVDEAMGMLQKMGTKVDGLLKQGVENLFKTTKARNPEAFKGWTPSVIEGGKGKTQGVGNLFKETKDKAVKFYDDIVEESTALAKRTGKDVRGLIEERIGYKFTGKESMDDIITIVREKFFKADGGRIGFNQGGTGWEYEPMFTEKVEDFNVTEEVPSRIGQTFTDDTQQAFRVGNVASNTGITDPQTLLDLSKSNAQMRSSSFPGMWGKEITSNNVLNKYAKQGISSDYRHALGTSAFKDSIIDYLGSNLGIDTQSGILDTIGSIGAKGATIIEEGGDAFSTLKQYYKDKKGDVGINNPELFNLTLSEILAQPKEDFTANWFAADQIPFGTSPLEKMKMIQAYRKFGKDNYAQQLANQKKLEMQQKIAAAEAAAASARAGASGRRPGTGGGNGVADSGGSTGGYSYDSGGRQGYGYGLADGGRIGFQLGGLSEQAQSIYDSWIDAGYSEEDVLAYLESRGLYNAPVIQEGIMTAPNIINQNLGGDGGGSNISPNYGTYQKEYTGMTMPDGTPIMSGLTKQKGPGFIEGLLELYENIPTPLNLVKTPLNLVKKGINKFQDWRTQQNQVAIDIQKKAEAERILKEKIAAAEAAAASARAGASGRRPGSGGQGIATDSTGTSYDAGGRQGYGYGLKDGGLATMFTRRR